MWHRQSPETLQGLQAASRRQCRGEASRVRFLVSRGVRQSCLHYAVTTYVCSDHVPEERRTYCTLKIIYCRKRLTIP